MQEPSTSEEVLRLHQLLRSDPQRHRQLCSDWIRDNPNSSHAYFDRHYSWMTLGEPQRALDDLTKAIELNPSQIAFMARGEVHRRLGELQMATGDFSRGEALNPADWQNDIVIGLLYQADCYARLGDERTALAYCARLPEDFWTPGMDGTPAGKKAEIADELRRTAARAVSGQI